jgi:prepilin-type N-terminal cleavage/methylation domain-containing protein
MPSHRGFALAEILVVIAVVVIIALLAVSGLFPSRRYNGERSYSTSLKTLASAEADFRANDRDWNHVNDFWTANVSGLYTMTSGAVKGATSNDTTDPSIKLIELSVASADADGSFYPAGGENIPLSSFAVPSAKVGYWFAALTTDLSLPVSDPERTYRQDTAGTPGMGKVHHPSKFGFIAFPDSQSSGKYICIVNENNTIFRSAVTGPVRGSSANPPGLAGMSPAYLNWPDDVGLKSFWAKLD